MSRPQLWVLAGGNGAGKTTFYRLLLEPRGVLFANADQVARQMNPANPAQESYRAAQLVARLREQLLRQRKSFCFETVFSHPSKVDFVAQAKAADYEIILVIVHLSSVALNNARVRQRVSEGGHYVPPDKVEGRVPRTLANLHAALPLCDQIQIFDNSSAEAPFEPVAVVRNQTLGFHADPMPEWARALLRDYLSAATGK